ncbi:heterokaryon incompatibility protein-domain-containing protein [Mariannaea sp. PMI_226]|nr:heterokaryon incompatibility protein-domain-containing protein [Mariannaea sp. PMI_226]
MWLFKSSEPDFSTIVTGIDRQRVCRGCSRIEILLDRSRRPDTAAPRGRLPFHKDFAELDKCAEKCSTCSIVRQALLLRCATVSDAEKLPAVTNGCTVFATVQAASKSYPSEPGESFQISIDIRDFPARSAQVSCVPGIPTNLNLSENPNSVPIRRQAQKWITNCHDTHLQFCSGLSWSSENPTRLVRILSDSELQLCIPGSKLVEYVALSYSWGTQLLSKEEAIEIQRGKTTPNNLATRLKSFPLTNLPSTLRDTISFCHRMGILHVWIDSLCIVQDESDLADFIREAPKMHQYYGNAHFTLAVCSNLKATDPLLASRTAFSYLIRTSKLGGLWIAGSDMSMKEMLSQSPLATRAWTLQEQFLSPRILYWTPNRMYWSCAHSQLIESIDTAAGSTASKDDLKDTSMQTNSPQAFLLQCNRGTAQHRHEEWLSVIESYTLRDMSNPSDRFAALSALASKYNSSFDVDQEYLAGLWKSTFAEDLSWAVVKPASTDPLPGRNVAPSWSWASLPLRTGICMKHRNGPSMVFKLINISFSESKHPKLPESQDSILRGALVKHVCVHTRIRPFWTSTARYKPWSAIISASRRRSGPNDPNDLTFSFSDAPEQSVFSADSVSGKVVAYDARKQEVVGQLDYVADAARICSQSMDIFAIEISESVALLVEALGTGTFQRVGIATPLRPDFLESATETEVLLV